MQDIKSLLHGYCSSRELPSYNILLSLLDSTISVLDGENTLYRPKDKSKKSGGLLDFSSQKLCDKPVVVVPDLHARGKFFFDILNFKFTEKNAGKYLLEKSVEKCADLSVLDCIEKGLLYLCCLGDIFHSEGRGRNRWIRAFEESSHGNLVNEFMTAEMIENLSLLEMILSLKAAYPSHFHVLKGNHENILNESQLCAYGNVPFRKFCDEGNMVADFLQNKYDDLILHEISCFEKLLPVCAVFKNCVVSHAEPYRTYSRSEIINWHNEKSEVVFGLTWTANGKAENGSVAGTMKNLVHKKLLPECLWLTGHRPVLENYALRQNGKLVQIHNPELENICLVIPERKFNPDEDIINVGDFYG